MSHSDDYIIGYNDARNQCRLKGSVKPLDLPVVKAKKKAKKKVSKKAATEE